MHYIFLTCNTVSNVAEDTKTGVWHVTPCILMTACMTSHYRTLQSPLLYFGNSSLVGCAGCDWVGGAFYKDKLSRKAQWITHLHGLLTLEAEGTVSLQNIGRPILWQTHCHIPASTTLLQDRILQLSFLFTATQIPDLIGDFSKPFILPLMEGRHQDLKTISADTLASLLNGDFSDQVESYVIIDCR